MNASSASTDDPRGIRTLIATALYDTSGESVEGAFVDRWVPNAYAAGDELAAIFARDGFSATDAAFLGAALRDPAAPLAAALSLLRILRRWVDPLIAELIVDPAPHARAIGVRITAQYGDTTAALNGMIDSDPIVRAASVLALALSRPRTPQIDALLRQALHDEAPTVRLAVASLVTLHSTPEGHAALLDRLAVESDPHVRQAIIVGIATEIDRAGTHVRSDLLRERVGAEVVALLIEQLDHPAPKVREIVARALERFRGADVAAALLDSLVHDEDLEVRRVLVLFGGYNAVDDRSLPVLAALLTSEPDTFIRTNAGFALDSFNAAAIAPLITALADDEGSVRRAAAMSLGRIGDMQALPGLLREYANPANRSFIRELEHAICDMTTRAAAPAHRPPAPDRAARIQRWIDALEAPSLGAWPIRVCKEELDALPVHATQLFLWAVRPDGELLCMDMEAFGHPTEPETDAVTMFAVLAQGARTYPDLYDIVPPCPRNLRPCEPCRARGIVALADETSATCARCSGLGWHV